MSLRLNRLWLLPVLLLVSQAWALGLGEIRLSSALNEPLRAEIVLLAATPEELDNLSVQLASVDTFQRYGLDRPLFLSGLQFRIVRTGTAQGNVVRITSQEPITEPFLTFLVEASWTRGRLLREYTLLLDPPTFAPPPVTQSTQAVTAPTRAPQTDSGQIERPVPQPTTPVDEPFPEPQADVLPPARTADAEPPSVAEPFDEPAPPPAQADFDTVPGGEIVVRRGDTLWGITSRVRPDSRLTMNQTMLAIYEANPQAFGGNINIMAAGATLRIPSADEVFRISRGDALAEVLRQNAAWSGTPQAVATETQPSLTLVPPDEEVDVFDEGVDQPAPEEDDAQALIDADEARISEIEALLSDHQNSLIEISDNQLAALRAELAALRGEEPPAPLPVEDIADETEAAADDEIFVDDETEPVAEDELMVDDGMAEEPAEDVVDTVPEETTEPEQTAPTVPAVVTGTPQPSLFDTILGYVNSIWGIIGGALLAAIALLVWFARRAGRGDDEDSTGMWESLEQDDVDEESMAATDRLRALADDEDDSSIVVVEQETRPRPVADSLADTFEEPAAVEDDEIGMEDSGVTEPIAAARKPASVERPLGDSMIDTFEMPAAEEFEAPEEAPEEEPVMEFEPISDDTSLSETVDEASVAEITPESLLEDTFHSDTAINLDQADPVAEADFHMAYGLYDQAADLINGALEVDPEREDLLAKLCEIYFVWGNRDAFIDAAGKLRSVASGDGNAEWDKIVIMGQQIAADHELFSGVSAAGATRAVDLSLDGGAGEGGALDIDFESGAGDTMQSVDLSLDDTQESGALDMDFESGDTSATSEFVDLSGDIGDDTAESRTVDSFLDDDTSEMPFASSDSMSIEEQFKSLGETGELPVFSDADDDATELADVFGDDATPVGRAAGDATAEIELDDLGLDLEGLDDTQIAGDDDEELDMQPGDLDDTSERPGFSDDLTRTGKRLGLDDDLSATGEMPGLDVTDKNLALPDDMEIDDTDVEIGIDLLDATGQTQALSEDDLAGLGDDDETVLASFGTDESTVLSPDIDVDFSKTQGLDETGEIPTLGSSATRPDMDLDDLTGILETAHDDRFSGADRDAPTAEMPHITSTDIDPDDIDLQIGDDSPTLAASPDDLDSDAERTMTEVGTKLDLARAYVDMGDPSGARSILEEVLNEGDEGQRQQAQQLLESMPS